MILNDTRRVRAATAPSIRCGDATAKQIETLPSAQRFPPDL